MKIKGSILCIIMLSFIISCEKPEGVGGGSSITGKVIVEVYDKEFKVLQETYPAVDEDVFIVYGNNEIYSDETNTSFNGMYKFEYLTKGTYNIFVYSEDNTNSSLHDIKIDTTIELTSNKTDIDAGDLTIYKTLDYDDGHAIISGFIYQLNFVEFSLDDTTRAQETDVYLVYEDNDFYIERIRTLDDGSYAFSNLLKGSYKVIAFADDIYGGKEKIARFKTVKINDIDENIELDPIYIENK